MTPAIDDTDEDGQSDTRRSAPNPPDHEQRLKGTLLLIASLWVLTLLIIVMHVH